ncbi:penicillin-binding protein [Sphingopyxis sp. Root1497]|uniref:serine hydrolase domain-containing protein n=1 Tax=Sphingopyxis sp. Root1497 TaxID=1736474 RepID=UPI0006F2C380|nr:serine hydrolase domain-containing protein [Sphingopyxis sp. Root1497]KQZ64318.1 penicillin-binding protein [Sphingopyxis sp. Root1497]
MRSRSRIALAALFAVASPAAAQDPAPKTLEQLAPDIDARFATFQTDAHIPGLVYGVVQNGKLVYVKGLGVQDLDARRPVTPDSLFRIASMTKAFTALSILSLRDQGKLRLDDLAEQYIPEMKGWTYPTKDSPRIRIRDLLQHVGGFVTDDPWGDRQQVLPQAEFTKMIAAGVPFSRAPQSQHEYSNFGYALLGRIVTKASGMAYTDYVRKTILTPLGMTASGFDAPAAPKDKYALGYRWENDAWAPEPEMVDGAFNAMGGLQVSANDYAKWVAFLLSAWPARDDPDTGPVRRSTVREIAQGSNFTSVVNRIGSSGADACKQSLAYGMGWRVAQDCELGLTLAHGGGYPGYGSHVMLMPDTGTGIFALANRTYAGPSGPAWDTAVAMDKAGLLVRRDTPVSPAIAEMFAATQAAYAAGDLRPLDGKLAMNFLLDRSADNWTAELAKLKDQVGACPTAEPLAPLGALSTAFRLNCEKGKIDGTLLLAPTSPVMIQAWRLRVVPGDHP